MGQHILEASSPLRATGEAALGPPHPATPPLPQMMPFLRAEPAAKATALGATGRALGLQG